MHHLQTRQLPVCRFSVQRVCTCISERRTEMAGERVKEKAGEIKRLACCCLLQYLLQQADFVLWLKVKSFRTSKTPMNYTALSLPPDPLSLSASHHHSLSSSLSSLRTRPACVNVSSLFCHMHLSQSSVRHMGCAAEEWNNLSPFLLVYTLPATCRFILQHLNVLFLHSAFLPNHCSQYFGNRIAVNSITAARLLKWRCWHFFAKAPSHPVGHWFWSNAWLHVYVHFLSFICLFSQKMEDKRYLMKCIFTKAILINPTTLMHLCIVFMPVMTYT